MLRCFDSQTVISAMAEPGLDVATSPQSDRETPVSSQPEKEIENPQLAESQAQVDRVLQSDVRLSTSPPVCWLLSVDRNPNSLYRSES